MAPRLWIIAAQFNQHIAQIFVIDAAHAFQLVKSALGHQIEVIDEPCHTWVIAVRFFGLKRKALGKITRANPRRVKALKRGQRSFCFG